MSRHTARGLVLRGDKLLLIERWRQGEHYFSVPGGAIEPNETPEQTVVRELAEETGCVVQVERQVYTIRFQDGTEHYIFLCRYVSGEPHLPANSPEALHYDADNRFQPGWLAVSDLAHTRFSVWKSLQQQLVHDLEYGFLETVRVLA